MRSGKLSLREGKLGYDIILRGTGKNLDDNIEENTK